MMIWRICVQPVELLGIFRRAVFWHPQFCDLKILIAKHVEQRHLADDRTIQIWSLRESGAHQKAAVRSSNNSQMIFVSIFLRDQKFCRGNEVVKHILLFVEHAGAVPVFSELSAATQIGDSIHATMLQPQKSARSKCRCHAHVESAVAGQHGWIVAVEFQSFLVEHEHGDARAIS